MKHKKYFTNHKPQTTNYAGFSFIEVMLAVFLVSVGITTTIALISLGIRKSTENRRQLIAVMLSQEGIELVRNIRDTDAKATPPDSFNHMLTGNRDYIIDYDNLTLTPSTGNAAERLKYVSGFYKHGAGTSSQFSRRIETNNTGAGGSSIRNVYSVVVWGDGSIPNNDPTEANCNLASRCTFTKITLTEWRE